MKKTILLTILGLSFFFNLQAQAQCNPQQYIEKSTRKLSTAGGGGYTFLKSYPVAGEKGKKYSYIFSQGTKYLIALANHDANSKGIYITIYDSNKREIASSYKDGKFYPAISFPCKKTGIYHMKFSFVDTRDYCAAAVLGMKR